MKSNLLRIATFVVCICAGGLLQHWRDSLAVHAQTPSVTFQGCSVTTTGGPYSPCSQYLVQVVSGRGLGRFQVFQVQGDLIPITGIGSSAFASVGAGNPSVSVQAFEPDPRGADTFTLQLNEP